MYYYPDNIQESILIFQKGKFDYANLRKIPKIDFEKSRIPLKDYHENDWYLSVWNITNVLPFHDRAENGIAAFPDEIPRRLIRLFSCVGETVLDPFLGSGTTLKVAGELGRNGWGFEIDRRLKRVIKKKLRSNNIQRVKACFMDRKIVRSARKKRNTDKAMSSG
jgi:DNA modification methylase